MSNVVIAVPTMGEIRTELASWLLAQNKSVYLTNCVSPHAFARNRIVEAFLRTDGTHLLMVDADTVPPDDAIERMLRQEADIVTGITPIVRENKAYANVFIEVTDVEDPYTFEALPITPFTVAACGASCLMVKRNVFLNIPKPWFKAIEFDNGNLCSEDMYFCEQVRQAGYKIIADPRIRCGHAKVIMV